MTTMTPSQLRIAKKRETEYWIYSYSDLITNLLALFVMMVVIMSSTEATKSRFRQGLINYTKGHQQVAQPNVAPFTANGISDLNKLQQIVSEYLETNQLTAQVSLQHVKNGIEMTFEGALLFDAGSAAISDDATPILQHIASLIALLPDKFTVDVEGHADRTPLGGKSKLYPSNWELSSARAGSVVRFLQDEGLSGKRLRAIGFADTRPLDETGESPANRRVVIIINAEEADDHS